MSTAARRLFVALWPDAATRRAIAAWQARWTWPPQARPTPPERLHLTLHFLGAVAEERLPALHDALATVPPARCTLALGTPGHWAHGLAVLCPAAWPPALQALHAELGARLAALGLPVEARPLRPHLTLARHAAGALPPPEPLALRWPVQGFALVESDRGYRVLARWPQRRRAPRTAPPA